MRQGHQNNKRMRGRGGRKGGNPLQRSYESNGPDVKIRGNALHVAEKYVQLARDAASSGDRVAEQNYLQHAEHYYRIVAAAQAQMPQQQQAQRNDGDGAEGERDETQNNRGNGEANDANAERGDTRGQKADQSKPYGLAEPQPYTNGAEANGDGGDAMPREAGNGDADAPQPAPRRRRAPRQRAPRGEIRVAAEEAAVPAVEE